MPDRFSPLCVGALPQAQRPAALALAWQVFCQFNAQEHSPAGVAAFRRTLDSPAYIDALRFYGAFAGGELVGMLAMRTPQHISLFFVQPGWQRQGVGRRLFACMRQDYALQRFTVNAAPSAVPAYRRLGFAPTADEQNANGVRYTPMLYAPAFAPQAL